MAYFGAGVFGKVHIGKRWEVGANVMFRHFSNGRLALPNEALNGIGVGVFARYRMSDYDYKRYKTKYNFERTYDRGMQYMIVVGAGVHKQPQNSRHIQSSRSALMLYIVTQCATLLVLV